MIYDDGDDGDDVDDGDDDSDDNPVITDAVAPFMLIVAALFTLRFSSRCRFNAFLFIVGDCLLFISSLVRFFIVIMSLVCLSLPCSLSL